MDCQTVRELLDAHALGALDVEERRAVEAHLPGCAECSALHDRARESAAAVALWAPLVAAGPALKARIMASAAVLTDLRRSRGSRWWAATAAAITAASIGIIAWNAALHRQVDGLDDQNRDLAAAAAVQAGRVSDLQSQLVSTQSATAAQDAFLVLFSQPDMQLVRLNGTAMAPDATGRYVWSASARLGAFDGAELPALGEGQVYKFWFIYESGWEDAGVVSVDEDGHGRLVVRRPEGPSRGRPIAFALTVEPALGGDTRSGAMVLRTPQE